MPGPVPVPVGTEPLDEVLVASVVGVLLFDVVAIVVGTAELEGAAVPGMHCE